MLNILEARITEIMTGAFIAQGHAVPAFQHSAEGQLWATTFPSISYDLGYPAFDPKRFIPDNDPIVTPTSQLEKKILTDGSVKQGWRRVSVRPHPKPYKIPLSINLWSKTHEDINDMTDSMLRAFQPRGTISFVDDLGTPRTWWMFLVGMPQDLSELYQRLDEDRKFHIIYEYEIEGWLEDVDLVKDRPTISSDPDVNIEIKDP